VIGLYYYGEVTMKQIGAEIGVNESRVSQLHARAIRRLRESLGEMGPQHVAAMRRELVEFAARKPQMIKAERPQVGGEIAPTPGVVLPYKRAAKNPSTTVRTLKTISRPRPAVAAAR
jgi:hypothetical protein